MKQKLLLTMLLLLAATIATAHDFVVDGIYYKINGSKATVTYRGDDEDFFSDPDRYIGDITIPETVTYNDVTYDVTSIGSRAFYNCYNLTSVTIPNSITSIGDYTFESCSKLTVITIPRSVTFIGECVFGFCNGLTSITVDSDNHKYDSRDNCNAIIKTSTNTLISGCQNTIIPNTVTRIGDYAFDGCDGLKSVTIPDAVTRIGAYAFNWCRGLSSVTIPNSVTYIGGYAFHFCDNLTILTIGNSVKTICEEAIEDCRSLTSLVIPASVSSIGPWAFRGCSGLTSITVESGNRKYDSRDNCNAIIETASNTLITGCQNTIIPYVTTIGSYAFSSCSNLTSITIPNSVTTICNSAFWNCEGLKDVYSFITDLANVTFEDRVFDLWHSNNYSHRTLHVPNGMVADYQADNRWKPYFGHIVEMASMLTGDLNGDGEINIADYNALVDMVLFGNATISESPVADVNGDGVIDIWDISAIVDLIISSN